MMLPMFPEFSRRNGNPAYNPPALNFKLHIQATLNSTMDSSRAKRLAPSPGMNRHIAKDRQPNNMSRLKLGLNARRLRRHRIPYRGDRHTRFRLRVANYDQVS